MTVNHSGTTVRYASHRRKGSAEFQASYGPIAPVQLRAKGTLENWLTERYCLYTVANGDVYRAEIHHHQWPLQNAAAEIQLNTMTIAAGVPIPQLAPLLHFSRRLDVLIWPLHKAR
jgi:uncharacterized protein